MLDGPSSRCPGASRSTSTASFTQCGAQVTAEDKSGEGIDVGIADANDMYYVVHLFMRIHPPMPPPISILDMCASCPHKASALRVVG
jgi:hypothetical protein